MSDFIHKLGIEYRGRRRGGYSSRNTWRKPLKGSQVGFVFAAMILVPVLGTSIFQRSYYDNYSQRDLWTELASHVRGGAYTGRVHCPETGSEILVFRAFGQNDAIAYLSEARPDCKITRLLFGAHHYRNGRWVNYAL